MTWPDTVFYLGLVGVVSGIVGTLLHSYKPPLSLEPLLQRVLSTETQVKEINTRLINIETGMEKKTMRIETLETRVQQLDNSFTKSVDNLKAEFVDMKQNVREDMQTLNNKMDANQKQIVDLLLQRQREREHHE